MRTRAAWAALGAFIVMLVVVGLERAVAVEAPIEAVSVLQTEHIPINNLSVEPERHFAGEQVSGYPERQAVPYGSVKCIGMLVRPNHIGIVSSQRKRYTGIGGCS